MSDNKKIKLNNWLKLKNDFFQDVSVKKIRKVAGGDTFLIIYQKIMLLTINSEGHYHYQNVGESIEEELSLILDEDIDNIRVTLGLAEKLNIIQLDDHTLFLPQVPNLIGKYDDSKLRVQAYRERQKNKCNALHEPLRNALANDEVTECNGSRDKRVEKEKEYIVQRAREPEPDNPFCPKPDPHYLVKMREDAFVLWQSLAKELNAKFTLSEWDMIYGYIMAKPSMQPHQIRTAIIALDKWANEGLDIENSLLTSHNLRELRTPFQKIVHDKNNKRLYGSNITDHRNAIIKREEQEAQSA